MSLSFHAEPEVPTSYLADLERSGVRVQLWQEHRCGGVAGVHAAATPGRYSSWSDGDIGIFVIDAGTRGLVSVDAQVVTDFLAIGIAPEKLDPTAIDLEADGVKCLPPRDIWIQHFHAGSQVRLKVAPSAFKTLTLVLRVSSLRDWVQPGLPNILSNVLEGQTTTVPLSLQIEREGDDVFATPADMYCKPLFYRMKSSTIFWLLLDELRRREVQEDCGAGKPISERVRRQLESVRAAIDEAPERHLGVEQLARSAGLNRTSLRASFKELYGVTLSQYRTAELMRRAQELLVKEQMPIKEAACALGYSDASSFSAAYKRYFRYPPKYGAVMSSRAPRSQ